MTLPSTWIGIDVSKAWLDIAGPARLLRIDNTAEAIGRWIDQLAEPGILVVFEATGHYDRLLRRQLAARGIAMTRVNPQRARDFARASGRLAKTDRLDAGMLAEMGRALCLKADPLGDEVIERLALLNKRRDQLVGMRAQERNRLSEGDDEVIAVGIARHVAWLDAEIAGTEKAIKTLVEHSPAIREREKLMRSMPGVGPVTAATLTALLPELGTISNKAAAMLAGLAPVNSDSGLRRGQRAIRGGRRRVRQALYMAAVTNIRHASPLRGFYDRLRLRGKPPKVALIALARKILTILNAIARYGQPFHA
jgi:transposase